MLHIRVPPVREAEHRYIVDVLLGHFLGLQYRITVEERSDIVIAFDGDPSAKTFQINDTFLLMPEHSWLQPRSLPSLPLPKCDPKCLPYEVPGLTLPIPVLFGSQAVDSEPWAYISRRVLFCAIDIFGSSFFMLTRYEELVTQDRDVFNRFPSTASIAYREGSLDRPIVNEYLEILWGALKLSWPQLKRRQRQYRAMVSHDVDWPLVTLGLSWRQVARSASGDLLVRRDATLAVKRLRSRVSTGRGQFDRDVGNVFDFMMDQSEQNSLRSAFYFITCHSAGRLDGTYDIGSTWIRRLLRKIHERGHEIGLHGSFNTYQNAEQTRTEFDRLLNVCDEEGIHQQVWGGRQHYLRWSNPDTWRNWDQSGLNYDSTLGFADQTGFRCSVCYEFPVFDLIARQQLRLQERPLIVMDGTLFRTTSRAYMALPDDQGLERFQRLLSSVRLFSGDFTVLWHNSSLISTNQRWLYQRCLVRMAD